MAARDEQQKLDALAELVNLGVGRAAASLSELVGQRIVLSIPTVRVCRGADCQSLAKVLDRDPETVITQAFHGMLNGATSLCFSETSSLALAQLLSGAPHGAAELDAELTGILLEVGNITINGVMGALSNAMSAVLTYSIPELRTNLRRDGRGQFDELDHQDILVGDVRLQLQQHDIQGSIVLVFEFGAIESLLDDMLQSSLA